MSGSPCFPEPAGRRSLSAVLERANLLQSFKPRRPSGKPGPLSHGRHICFHLRLRPPLLAHIQAHPRRHPYIPLALPAGTVEAVKHVVRSSDSSDCCLQHCASSQTRLAALWIPCGGGGVSKRLLKEHSLQVKILIENFKFFSASIYICILVMI